MREGDQEEEEFARLSLDRIDVGLVHCLQGRFQEGVREIQKAMRLMEESPGLLASLGYAYALAGDREEAEKILADLEALSKRHHLSPFTIALVHVALGDKEKAFQWLERSVALREDALVSLRVNPRLDPLHGEPRFSQLLRQVGHPAAAPAGGAAPGRSS